MADYSSMSDADLQKLYSQQTQQPQQAPQQSSGTDYSKMSNEDLQALYNKQTNPEEPSTLSKVGNYVSGASKAISGGIWSGIADTDQGIGNGVTALLQHTHIISPETANKLYAAVKDNSDLLRPDSGNFVGPSSLTPAVQQHPVVSGIGQYGLDAYMLGAGGSALAGAAGELAGSAVPASQLSGLAARAGLSINPSTISGVGQLAGRLSGMGAANAMSGDPKDMGTNFFLGMGGQAVSEVVGKLASYIGGNAQRVQQINNIVSNYSKSKADQAYDAIRSLPFGQADKTQTNIISNHVGQLLSDNELNLSQDQARILKNTAINLNQANSFDDVLKEYQNLGKSIYKNFTGSQANRPLFKEITNVKNMLGEHINNAATAQGINDALSNASNAYRTRMALSGPKTGIFNNMNENLDSFSFKTATNQLNKKIAYYSEMKGMEPTVQTLKGLSKLTKEISSGYKLGYWGSRAAGAVIGASAAGSEGYELRGEMGGLSGAAGGAVAGVIAAPWLMQGINKFASSPQGQAVLRALAKPGMTQQDIRNVAKGAMMMGVNWFNSQGKQDQGNQ